MSHEPPEAFPRYYCDHVDLIARLTRERDKATRERDEAITALLDLRAEHDQRAADAHTYLRLHAAKEHSREVGRILTLTLSPAPATVPTDGAGEGVL